jgi:hypothetical protein
MSRGNRIALELWASELCNHADGTGTAVGFTRLGPVVNFGDLLIHGIGDPEQLLAAEQLSHLVSGLRYASSALGAFLNHSNDAAIHFAYYAQLRAANSLYAWSGIRSKWGNYFYLDSAQQKHTPSSNPPTHDAIWALWTEWVKRPDARNLLGGKIQLIASVKLDNVIDAIRFTQPQQALLSWGSDLLNVGLDKKSRNDASYNANWIGTPIDRMSADSGNMVKDLWTLFLTDGISLGFDATLCNYFVQNALNREAAMQNGAHNKAAYLIKISSHISANTGVPDADILRRLDPAAYPTRIFDLASSADRNVENILSRSFVMLRIAILATHQNLQAAPNRSSQTWLSHWLEHAGLWDPNSGVALEDLETDYADAAQAVASSQPMPSTFWIEENLKNSILLTRPEACVSWSLIA